MRSAAVLNRYWNDRLDPLDWKRATDDRRAGDAWKQALETFVSPHVLGALDMLGDLRGKRVLDLGCGAGYGSVQLARRGASVVGLDIADRRCARARLESRALAENLDVTFVAGDAEGLPFAAGHFDLIFSSDVLMYSETARVVAECHRVLAPGGRVAFVEALAGNPVVAFYRRWSSPGPYRAFTRHLGMHDLGSCGGALRLETQRCYYLLSLAAFGCLFVLRSTALYRAVLSALGPCDAWLLTRFPRLRRFAWRSVALYRKSSQADER